MADEREETRKKKVQIHRTFKCVGGPADGATVRYYPDNPREVRLGKEPIFSPMKFDNGEYVLEGGKARWVSQ